MFDWTIPMSDRIGIASGALHHFPPCFYLMLSSPLVYHILSHVIFALTVFFRVQPTRLIARLIVLMLTRTPWVCSQKWQ